MEIPLSMRAELGQWNEGKGIDLESWVGCEGRFSLAVGYSTIFWPEFEEIDGYILRKGTPVESIRGFENSYAGSRLSVEATLNHFHLEDIQHLGCADASPDKLLALGQVLKEIYEAKLKWQFPHLPCTVSFHIPDDSNALDKYEISFWQKKHEVG